MENPYVLSPNTGQDFRRKSFREKYGHAAKIAIPIRSTKANKKSNTLPNTDVGCLSFLSLSWMTNVMWRASRKGISKEDLGNIASWDSVDVNYDRLLRLWHDELRTQGPEKASFGRTVWKFSRTRLIMAGMMMFWTSIFHYVGPAWILEYLLYYLSDMDQPVWIGIVIVVLLSVTQFLRHTCYSGMYVISVNAGIRAQGAIQALIYEKLLQKKNGNEKLLAEVVNYCTSDIERIFQGIQLAMMAVGAPVMLIINIIYTYMVLGPWSLIGNLVIVLYYPLMAVVAKHTGAFRQRSVKITDQRIGLMNSILGNIKLIKTYAWEESFSNNVKVVRHQEEKILRKAAFLQSASWTIAPIISMVSPMICIFGYVLSGNNITTYQAFTLVAVYGALQLALNVLPISVKAVSEAVISCQRLQKMLLKMDAGQSIDSDILNPNFTISMVNASIAWQGVSQQANGDSPKSPTAADGPTDSGNGKGAPTSGSVTESKSFDSLNARDDNGNNRNLVTVFSGLNVNIEKGKLIGICGSVGSGKSTILATISGSTMVMNGRVSVSGSIAYVTQQAWIFSGTVRENILFGLEYDETRYKMVLFACSLETDLMAMPDNDLTEIGERGGNLSGGQKQRINLARAVYSNRDIYLLDDTLSAVDVKVSKHIFKHCIRTALRGKTVLLVTHAMNLLEKCDYVFLVKEGEISEEGTHEELMMAGDHYADLFLKSQNQNEETENQGEEKEKTKEKEVESEVVQSVAPEATKSDGPMIKDEVEIATSLTMKTWWYYCRMCGGYCVCFLTFFTIIFFNVTIIFNSLWLQIWMDAGAGSYNASTSCNPNFTISNASFVPVLGDVNVTSPLNETTSLNGTFVFLEAAALKVISNGSDDYDSMDGFEYCLNATQVDYDPADVSLNPQLYMYIAVYGASAILVILSGLMKGYALGKTTLRGASQLHHAMFWSVIRSPMSFFDVTPIARLITRFSRDMDELDVNIPFTSEFVSQSIILILFQFILIGVLYPIYFVGLVVVVVAFLIFDSLLNAGVKETKRMDNLLRPPILVHLSTTVQGLSVIRSYQKQHMFSKKFRGLVENHLSASLLFQLSSKWLAFRADTLSWLALTATAILVLCSRGIVSAAVAGLAISQILKIASMLAIVLRWKSELQARLLSIERVAYYCRDLTEEAPAIVANNRPSKEWPSEGRLVFHDLQMRYRPNLPLVLRSMTARIEGGEKVGIIGRTGAGKSTVIGAILRLTEASAGSIIVDGLDISKIGLKDLRSKISVIPQEPVLFAGTIRWNLDPFSERSDEEIWKALEKSYLKNKVSKEVHLLETELDADGGMFSLGEKQLFCMARALLRNSKILLLDEATASVDMETDKLIQESIRTSFAHCTVLTIAHRLNTIADYDKILALDAGKVVEFDSPENLMATDSLFRSMMNAMQTNNQDGHT